MSKFKASYDEDKATMLIYVEEHNVSTMIGRISLLSLTEEEKERLYNLISEN